MKFAKSDCEADCAADESRDVNGFTASKASGRWGCAMAAALPLLQLLQAVGPKLSERRSWNKFPGAVVMPGAVAVVVVGVAADAVAAERKGFVAEPVCRVKESV